MGLFPRRMTRFRRKLCATFIALALFVLVLLKSLSLDDSIWMGGYGAEYPQGRPEDAKAELRALPETKSVIKKIWKEKVASIFRGGTQDYPPPNYNLHVFYYSWYGNPKYNGRYIHWNHPFLPHWNPHLAPGYATGTHTPPDDIGSNFYPALGAYSSRDPSIIEAHMQQIRTAAIGVLALSWYPSGMYDDQGEPAEDIVPLILATAAKYQVKVVFHIEPYKGRNDKNMFENVRYIIDKYGDHPAFYRYKSPTGTLLPLFYVYDSYLQSSDMWARLLKSDGIRSIRNTNYDSIFVALLVEEKHKSEIKSAGFDGVYTYFATNSFSYGSSQRNWQSIKAFCNSNNLIFIPSVGPGYIDTSIRPWNAQNTRYRLNGRYYETSMRAALDTSPAIISVTSFNEWHEGTQIETAVPKARGKTAYLDYLPYKPTLYLYLTRKWAEKFAEQQQQPQ